MNNLRMHSLWFLIIATFFIGGCVASSGDGGSAAIDTSTIKSIKDYPNNAFDAKAYVKGMQKGGKNLLIWVDPSADFSKYKSVSVSKFGKRLLPKQDKFSYDTFVATFNNSLQGGITLNKNRSSSVKIVGELVECNPGSRAGRYFSSGLGGGKAAGAVACEIYLPGKSKPSMRIYARDRASSGFGGGDSVAMLNHIFTQVGFRVANILNTRIGR